LEIKSKNSIKTSFTISLANGWGGYLLTPEQYQSGGYETWLVVNKVEKEAFRKIVAEFLSIFSKME
jgi:hypothetical protein